MPKGTLKWGGSKPRDSPWSNVKKNPITRKKRYKTPRKLKVGTANRGEKGRKWWI